MYLRFVRLSVREGEEAKFAKFYRDRVIAELESTPGCRFAGLLRPWRGSEHRSLTIWDSPEAAEAYEKSGLYHRLLRESEAMLDSTTRLLFSAVVGRELPAGLVVNAWRLAPGDHMGAHPDGPRYYGTISLGLNAEWSPTPPREFFSEKFQRGRLETSIALREQEREFRFGLFTSEPEILVGTLSLRDIERGIFQNATIGYSVDAMYRNRGVAAMMLRNAMEFALGICDFIALRQTSCPAISPRDAYC